MSQNLPKRSLRNFVFITSSLPSDSSWPLFKKIEIFSGILTVNFKCKYFPYYTRELLECLLGISPSRQNPCGGNYPRPLPGSCERVCKSASLQVCRSAVCNSAVCVCRTPRYSKIGIKSALMSVRWRQEKVLSQLYRRKIVLWRKWKKWNWDLVVGNLFITELTIQLV